MFGIFKSISTRKYEADLEIKEYKISLMSDVQEAKDKAAQKIRTLKINANLEKSKLNKEIEELAISCANDRAAYEHTYHSKMEELGISIAKQEARLEIVQNDENTYHRLISDKNSEIERLTNIVNSLLETIRG